MAWFPPSRDDVDRGLRIPDLREGSLSPLSYCQRSLPGTCLTQRLPTQRLRRCGLSATSRIQLPPCADGLSSRSSPISHAARAARRNQRDGHVVIYDAVVLVVGKKSAWRHSRHYCGRSRCPSQRPRGRSRASPTAKDCDAEANADPHGDLQRTTLIWKLCHRAMVVCAGNWQ
jgi:hypothetical protein